MRQSNGVIEQEQQPIILQIAPKKSLQTSPKVERGASGSLSPPAARGRSSAVSVESSCHVRSSWNYDVQGSRILLQSREVKWTRNLNMKRKLSRN